MGNLGSIRLAAHGNQTPITPSYIYYNVRQIFIV